MINGMIERRDDAGWCVYLYTILKVGAFGDLVCRDICIYWPEIGFALGCIIQSE